ncbi:glycoside hydrolase family 5 protein [Fibrella aquatilis]|uniref:Cellulase family glycosylhydrolase n=1 Tax=Fibrella aquatilis TaxID=2817059 RepID=A0A939G0G6_9BACT|nr:cellulase family glycosylhydrolase [Fibrella aquatilis]MBO0929596.1 cellulase family glycosylhydrolase [Fibrella aquatilis]
MRLFTLSVAAIILLSQCQSPEIAQQTEPQASARVGAPGTLLAQYPTGIPALKKGINLSNWFGSGSSPAQFTTRFTSTAFAQIKAQGFLHVRIPIGPNQLFQEATPSLLKPATLSALNTGVNGLLAAGLAVIIDPIHASGDSDFEQKLANDPAFLPKAQAYWRAIATNFKAKPNTQVFFEVMNEPHMASTNPAWYKTAQDSLISAIRSVVPNHVIIATAPDWSSMDALLAVTPTNKNVLWNFHYYSPMVFTHQGADWITPTFGFIKNLPYPSTPTNVQSAANAAGDATAKQWMLYYGTENWNAAKIMADLGRINTWAITNGVLVSCNEFGVYKTYVANTPRCAYLGDVRKALEAYQIGWSMWEYDEGFGYITYKNATTRTGVQINTTLKTALGL